MYIPMHVIVAAAILLATLTMCMFFSQIPTPPTIAPVRGIPVTAPRDDSGCGSRGGPGFRLASGKCASWDDVR